MHRIISVFCLMVILGGCARATAAPVGSPAASATSGPTQFKITPSDTPPAAATGSPSADIPPTATLEPTLSALAPNPQRIEFRTEDGVTLVGYYHPAAAYPAPLVVLMHWAGGDQTDWSTLGLVAWLQNRGQSVPPASGTKSFDTPYTFPPLPADLSVGVFTFDFRGYGESEGTRDWPKHVLDARAAYRAAAALDGVEPGKIVGIGASIGSDAVVDGCEACAGALSLSPGSFLSVAYPQAVKALDDQGKPVWCLAADDDPAAAATCNAAAGTHYHKQVYSSGGHALELFRAAKGLQPPVDAVILDFLHAALDLPKK